MTGELRLRAGDGEDLCVLAAILQDAHAPINEMVFEPEARRFLAAFTRRRRERGEQDVASCVSILRLDHVNAVHWRGLRPQAPEREHVVLTLLEEAPGRVLLLFQDGEALRFEVERIDARLVDFQPEPATRGADEAGWS